MSTPPPANKAAPPLVLVFGEDDYGVKKRARQLYDQWCAEAGGMDHEAIDASAANSGEALRSLAKLREALQTLPFFGAAKVVWFQNCNFLGDDRTSTAQAVTESLTSLAQELKSFRWTNVRLLISAGKVDKRKTFYKTMEKIGGVEPFAALSIEDKDWARQAEVFVERAVHGLNKRISDEALGELVSNVGPNFRELTNEVQKVALHANDRPEITVEDVAAVVTRHRQARAFALGDALGDRDLPRLLRRLDEELWEMRSDTKKSAIGLLYGLISKIRVLIFLREMQAAGFLKPESDFSRFKTQLERLPADILPADKRYNPLAMNAYVLFKALPQARNYTTPDLVRAMDLLLECNQRLVSSRLDEGLVLQQALVQIAGKN